MWLVEHGVNEKVLLHSICYLVTPSAHPAILHCLFHSNHTQSNVCAHPFKWEISWALQSCSEDCCSSLLWCVAVSLHKVACCLHGACALQLHGASLGCISQQVASLHFSTSLSMCLFSVKFVIYRGTRNVLLLSGSLHKFPCSLPLVQSRHQHIYFLLNKDCGRYCEPCIPVLRNAAQVCFGVWR